MKILIVDDEPLVRRSLSRACEKAGHEVVLAEDGLKGLDLWREQDPDLVFLDVLMPGMTGPQLLDEIGQGRRAKVVLMSAYGGEHNLQSAQQIGADIFVPKPFENIFETVKVAESLLE